VWTFVCAAGGSDVGSLAVELTLGLVVAVLVLIIILIAVVYYVSKRRRIAAGDTCSLRRCL